MLAKDLARFPPATRFSQPPVSARVRIRKTDFPLIFLGVGILVATVFTNSYYTATVLSCGVTFRLMDLVLAMLLGIGLVPRILHPAKQKHFSVKGEREVIFLLIAFFIYGLTETARSIPHYGVSVLGVARYTLLDLLWVPVILMLVDSEKRLSNLLYGILTLLPLGWTIRFLVSYFFDDSATLEENVDLWRFIDSFAAMCLISFTAVIFPFVAVNWPAKRRLGAIPLVVLGGMGLVCTAFAQHRSVWLATIAGVFYVWAKLVVRTKGAQRKRVMRVFAVTLAMLVLGLMAFAVFAPGLSERRLAFVNGIEQDHTGYWRVQGWIWIMRRVMTQNPVFGLGFGDVGFPDPDFPDNFLDVPDHNQYITVLRSCGMLGLCLYLALIGAILRLGRRVYSTYDDGFARLRTLGFSGMIVMSLIYSVFYNYPPTFPIGIGLIIVSGRCAASRRIAEGPKLARSAHGA